MDSNQKPDGNRTPRTHSDLTKQQPPPFEAHPKDENPAAKKTNPSVRFAENKLPEDEKLGKEIFEKYGIRPGTIRHVRIPTRFSRNDGIVSYVGNSLANKEMGPRRETEQNHFIDLTDEQHADSFDGVQIEIEGRYTGSGPFYASTTNFNNVGVAVPCFSINGIPMETPAEEDVELLNQNFNLLYPSQEEEEEDGEWLTVTEKPNGKVEYIPSKKIEASSSTQWPPKFNGKSTSKNQNTDENVESTESRPKKHSLSCFPKSKSKRGEKTL